MNHALPPAPSRLAIDFAAHPLVPAVIVEATSGEVLMIGFMNEAAYRATRATGRTHFWSRSRNMLWKKGERSGHEQIVQRVAINCESNALLITVHQIGAVCHTGHPSCFFRDIEDDESLTVTMDRVFDPATIYGHTQDLTLMWYEAFVWLRDNPLDTKSRTSSLLRGPEPSFAGRIADELAELAGVLDGTHRHSDLHGDVLLEGSQCLYWLCLAAIAGGVSWATLRPDRALDTAEPSISASMAASLLRSDAEAWRSTSRDETSASRIHQSMALVAQAAQSTGLEPLSLVRRDLDELRAKPYLSPYFSERQMP
jgi:phosphoribosyl-AMP cyclohydrolase